MSDDEQHSAVDEVKALDQAPTGNAKETVAESRRGEAASYYAAQAEGSEKLSMQVRVRSPFRTYYDDQAFSISAVNATGPFDILPHHHNFICLLEACELLVRTVKDGEQKILISGGMMHVKADQVLVFLDI